MAGIPVVATVVSAALDDWKGTVAALAVTIAVPASLLTPTGHVRHPGRDDSGVACQDRRPTDERDRGPGFLKRGTAWPMGKPLARAEWMRAGVMQPARASLMSAGSLGNRPCQRVHRFAVRHAPQPVVYGLTLLYEADCASSLLSTGSDKAAARSGKEIV